jgi:hypothetical protein
LLEIISDFPRGFHFANAQSQLIINERGDVDWFSFMFNQENNTFYNFTEEPVVEVAGVLFRWWWQVTENDG